MKATLDRDTRVLTFILETLDPATGWLPEDPLTGLLYPNDATGRGVGSISYIVKPKAGLPSGTVIDNRAQIVFDYNEPIDTPLVYNTLDSQSPTSTVATLPATTDVTTFTLSWVGNDESGGSGIARYDIYASVDGGDFFTLIANTTTTSAGLTGERGHTYAFYSVATDNVGHRELPPTIADTTTTVEEITPVAIHDGYLASENTALVILPSEGVLANDDGGRLSAMLVKTAAQGTLVLKDDGSFEYTPNANFNREESFQYRAGNSVGESAPVTVTIAVATAYPWHNGINPVNVNDDRYFDGSKYVDDITPLDALLVINNLNANGVHTLPLDRPRPLAPPFLDVSRDGQVTPFDALLVINFLNKGSGNGEGEISADSAVPEATSWHIADMTTQEPVVADLSAKDQARDSRATDSRQSSNFLQSLDLLFARLDIAQHTKTEESTVGRNDKSMGNLEEFLDSMFSSEADEDELFAITAG